MSKKNILELCLAHGLGGLEMFAATCYKDFSKKTVCKIAVAPGEKLDRYLEVEDKFLVKRNKFFPFFPALKLAKFIDSNDIDIVHFHWTRDMITAVLAKLISKKKPKIVQSRHMGMTRFKDDLYHRFLYKNIDMMHAVTQKVKEDLEKFIPKNVRPKLKMVYLGTEVPKIDTSLVQSLRETYRQDGVFVVGIVGRIEEGKGQYKLIEALKELENLNIKVLIVGSAMKETYLQELKERVEELCLKERVVFVGFTKNVHEYLQVFDVNVLATENETFGLVVIEAMANKVPMIATNKGGPLEIIKDGADGLLFDGSVEDLAVKIELLAKDENFRGQIAQSGYETVMDRFNAKIQNERLYKVMNE